MFQLQWGMCNHMRAHLGEWIIGGTHKNINSLVVPHIGTHGSSLQHWRAHRI